MTYLASRLSVIKPSPTLAALDVAKKRKASGEDIIILAAGEPDFDTPAHIKVAANNAMDKGWTRYTAVDGMPALKKVIQTKFSQDNALEYDLSEIMVSAGGKQVIFNALMATCNLGDEVIVPAPYWVSYPDIAKLFGATPIYVECDDTQGFKLMPDELAKHLTPQTKWVILGSPGNPTGAVYTRNELVALGEVLKKHSCLILSDDIYEYLTYEGDFCNIAMACPELKNRTLVVNGLSKSYAMTGWRIGYGAGPKDLIQAMTMIQSQSTSNACSVAQGAAIEALTQPREFLEGWKASFMARREHCLMALNNIHGLECVRPSGAFYLYVKCAGVIGKKTPSGSVIATDQDFTTYLLDAQGVAVVPGGAFGLSPYFRISYATSLEELVKACERISKAVGALVP